MAAFFVKTEQSSAGPFTGVELREAALAGIVGPDTPVAAGPSGPWTKAEDAGLFSEKKLPLPHPPGTPVPLFQVRGMQGSLTGPFKLRELIGFAARGMLPADVMLKSDMSPEWISLQRIPVLVSCLSGQLVVLGEGGKVHRRTRSANGVAKASSQQGREATRVPSESTKSIDITTSSAHRNIDIDSASELIIVGDQGLVIDEAEIEQSIESDETDSAEPRTSPRRLRIPSFPSFRLRLPAGIHPRLVVNTLCLLLVVAGIGAGYSYWRKMGMSPNEILGDWVGGGEPGMPAFGISFREDSSCVVFSTQGESWSGDFTWATRTDDGAGFEEIDPFSSQVAKIDAAHQRGPVQLGDGYIRLRGFIEQPPSIGGHRIGDCFLRRDGENLKIGYLANVTWTRSAKTMEAGWITVRPVKANHEADIVSDLIAMEVEKPANRGYAVERSPHISVAITNLMNSQEADALDGDVGNGSTCYSVRVNGDYLLRTYGIPDEARAAYPFEIPQIGQSFEGSQVVRYGVLKFILRPDGTIQYVSIML